MKIIDLTCSLKNGVEYYPGDPKTEIIDIEKIENTGWNMKRLKINSHDCTHVNMPIHSKVGGKTLDDYKIDDFIGESILYEKIEDIKTGFGIIFSTIDISREIAEKIVEIKPKFVGLSINFEFNIEVERYLLENDIISFERLKNTEKLPKKFIFHGVPLKIKNGDGSPIRAYAII